MPFLRRTAWDKAQTIAKTAMDQTATMKTSTVILEAIASVAELLSGDMHKIPPWKEIAGKIDGLKPLAGVLVSLLEIGTQEAIANHKKLQDAMAPIEAKLEQVNPDNIQSAFQWVRDALPDGFLKLSIPLKLALNFWVMIGAFFVSQIDFLFCMFVWG
jgi:hypothetical protein